MGVFKEIVEPAVIFSLFTAGALYNRRSVRDRRRANDCEASGSPTALKFKEESQSLSDSHRTQFHDRLLSRFLAAFPFLIEIWYWLLTYWIYQIARAASAHFIRGNETILHTAQVHALQVLNLEKLLGLDFEISFQKAILEKVPGLMTVFRHVYQFHIVVGVWFVVYTYTFFPLHAFQRVRRTLAVDNWLAFAILTSYRCMPPRLLPSDYGYIDIMHSQPQSVWANNRWRLTIAAMPSLHFGTASFIGYSIWTFAPRSHALLRYAAVVYPFVMLATILATANHFLLDALVGLMVPIVGWRLQEVLLKLLPLEERGFHLLGIEKPAS